MSTNSMIAEFDGDSARGRYCHSDGYPTWQGRNLWTIVQRDGVEVARHTLLHEHFGWSFLDATRDAAGFEDHLSMLGPDRAVLVPGYGLAYTAAEEPDHWGDPRHYEWGWILSDTHLVILFFGNEVDRIPWGRPEPDWAEIEKAAYSTT